MGSKRFLTICLFAITLGMAVAISKDDFFPYLEEDVDQLVTDDGEIGTHFPLKVPVVLGGKSYSDIYVNIRGIVTFTATKVGTPKATVFSPAFPAIAPFFADIENVEEGLISFRESTNTDLLETANAYVHQAFPSHSNFQAKSLLITTWLDVVGHGNPSQLGNNFQLLVANSGEESFAAFLYPYNGLVWASTVSHQDDGEARIFAQAGLNDGTSGPSSLTLAGSGSEDIRRLTVLHTPLNRNLPFGVHIFNL